MHMEIYKNMYGKNEGDEIMSCDANRMTGRGKKSGIGCCRECCHSLFPPLLSFYSLACLTSPTLRDTGMVLYNHMKQMRNVQSTSGSSQSLLINFRDASSDRLVKQFLETKWIKASGDHWPPISFVMEATKNNMEGQGATDGLLHLVSRNCLASLSEEASPKLSSRLWEDPEVDWVVAYPFQVILEYRSRIPEGGRWRAI